MFRIEFNYEERMRERGWKNALCMDYTAQHFHLYVFDLKLWLNLDLKFET